MKRRMRSLKKIITLGFAAAMCLSATACSVTTAPKEDPAKQITTTAGAKPSGEAEKTSAPEASTGGAGASGAAEPKSGAASGASGLAGLMEAAGYPAKPLTMIIPYGAGGTTDTWGRKLAAMLEKYLGQSVTVTNQGGASGSIGSQFVKEQASDGYTLLVCSETMGTYRTMNVCDLDYDDFSVISPLVGDPKVLVVGKDSKYQTLEELLGEIKANPGKITMSHSGPGGSGHNQGLVLKELGYEVAMTSFDSGNDALLGVIGGQVDFTNPNISTLGGYIESGDVRPLAVFAGGRMGAYPDIPAFTETVPESEKYLNIPYTLLSFVVNDDTPQEVVDVLKAASRKVFEDPEWTEFVKANAADPVFEQYTDEESIRAFYDNWKSVICWLQYENGVAEKSPEEFGIKKIGE